MYCAIIGDIVDSRKIKERREVQEILNAILLRINNEHTDDIASKFTITLGDEFQALLLDPCNLFKILDLIKIEMSPVKIRFGIGFGEIFTDINKEISLGSDGPAYYIARDSLNEIKENSKRYEQPIQNVKIDIDEKNKRYIASYNEVFNLINANLSLCSYMENKWTKKQKEIIIIAREQNISQRQIANMLELDQSTIQRSLASAGYYTYKYSIEITQKAINSLWEDINDK